MDAGLGGGGGHDGRLFCLSRLYGFAGAPSTWLPLFAPTWSVISTALPDDNSRCAAPLTEPVSGCPVRQPTALPREGMAPSTPNAALLAEYRTPYHRTIIAELARLPEFVRYLGRRSVLPTLPHLFIDRLPFSNPKQRRFSCDPAAGGPPEQSALYQRVIKCSTDFRAATSPRHYGIQ